MSGATPPPAVPVDPIPVAPSPLDKTSRPAPSPVPAPPQPPKTKKNTTEYEKGREKFLNKANSEYFDPCQEAASLSLRCLYRNQGDKELCSDYFQAYRDCKKRWLEERKKEKRKATAWW